MTFPFVVAPLVGVAIITAAVRDFGVVVLASLTDVAALVGVASGALLTTITLAGVVWRYVRKVAKPIGQKLDALNTTATEIPPAVAKLGNQVKGLQDRMDSLERQRGEDQDRHDAAHTEMLSMVNSVSEKVDRIEQQHRADHEHVAGLTRELGVPVRKRPAA